MAESFSISDVRSKAAAKRALLAAIPKTDLTLRERAALRAAVAFRWEETYELICGILADEGKLDAQGKIDWEAIGDFIVKIAPVILELILKLAPLLG